MSAVLELKNLHRAAEVLVNLRDWTNANSDGWPYWNKPSRASARLQGTLQHMSSTFYRGGEPADITDSELVRLCVPVKSFLTRQEVDHSVVFKP